MCVWVCVFGCVVCVCLGVCVCVCVCVGMSKSVHADVCQTSSFVFVMHHTMGQTNSGKGITLEELLTIVRKYRPHAEAKQLVHRWSVNGKSRAKSQENKEYIIYTHHA